jgi:hypothetical protein
MEFLNRKYIHTWRRMYDDLSIYLSIYQTAHGAQAQQVQ